MFLLPFLFPPALSPTHIDKKKKKLKKKGGGGGGGGARFVS
eukprot:COSAG06_NODE_65085_length_258_cov_0.477987_1_plen_40_part_10